MRFVQVWLVVAAIVGWSESAENSKEDHPPSINLKLRRSLEDSVNPDVKPCSDFYEYACGNWEQDRYVSVAAMLHYEVNKELIQYMDDTHMTGKPEFVQNAYNYYTSCVDVHDYSHYGYMKWMAKHENMTWALLASNAEKDAKYDWVHTLAKMRKYAMNGVFIEENMLASKKLINLGKHGRELKKITEHEITFLNFTEKLPTFVMSINDLWNEISEFENLLAKLHEDEVYYESAHVTSAEELDLPWLKKYLEIILDQDPIDSELTLIIKDMTYMDALVSLLEKYDDAFISRYLEIRFLLFLPDAMDLDSDNACMDKTRTVLPMALHWIYEQLHPELMGEFPKINEMFGNIMKSVNQTLRSDQSGVVPAWFLAQLDNMHLKLGNLPRVDTVKVLEAFYTDLALKNSDWYGNHLQLLAFHFKLEHTSPTNEGDLDFNKFFHASESLNASTDAYPLYLPEENIVIVPMELLRQPIYHWGYDRIFQYSGLGTIIIHSVYSTLELNGFTSKDIRKIADVGSMHSTFATIFSSEEIEKEVREASEILNVSLKELFFLHAAHYHCESHGVYDHLNRLFTHLPEFVDAFDCKLNSFLDIFAQ